MNKRDRAILYGMSLGDGCVSKQNTNKNYGLTIGHGPNQRDYLQHKAGKLHSIFGGKVININEYQSFNKTSGKTYTNLQIRKTHPYFNQIHKNLYRTGKKVFTRKVLDFLSDEGLAYWFMDDGSGSVLKNRDGRSCGCSLRIATYFSLEEAEICKDWFAERYSVLAKFDTDKRSGRVSLRFGTLDSKKLANTLSPHIVDCLRYKIDCVLNYSPRVLDSTNVDEDIV